MYGERERKKREGGLKRGSENEIVKVASGRRGSRTTSERRNEEGPGRRERDGVRGPRFGEPLNSRGPGLEAGFVVEPSWCMYMR